LKNNNDISVIILEALGKVFCSGHDLKEFQNTLKIENETEKRKILNNVFTTCSDVMI